MGQLTADIHACSHLRMIYFLFHMWVWLSVHYTLFTCCYLICAVPTHNQTTLPGTVRIGYGHLIIGTELLGYRWNFRYIA